MQAVQTSQKGQFVFVVSSDNVVAVRPVVLGDMVEKQSVIREGVQAGERA